MKNRVVLEHQGPRRVPFGYCRIDLGVAESASYFAGPELPILAAYGPLAVVKLSLANGVGAADGVEELILDPQPLELLPHGGPARECVGEAYYEGAHAGPILFR